jgi:DNA repair protein RecO (recombination protein O)
LAIVEYTGLVAKLIPYRESDLIVWLITREAGLISAIAVGARKSRKRFANLFDIANVISVKAARRRRGMARVDSGMLIHGFWELSQSVQLLAAACHVVELTRRFSVEDHAEPEIFDLVVIALKELAAEGVGQFRLRAFEMGILALAGLAPNLEHCIGCQKKAGPGDDVKFSIARSGIVCGKCARDSERNMLPAHSRELLQRILASDIDGIFKLSHQPKSLPALNSIIPALLEYHIGAPLKSLRFARSLPRPGQYAEAIC